MDVPPPAFLDVPMLLESSQPRPRVGWFWYAAGVALLLMLISAFAGGTPAKSGGVVEALSGLAMIGLVIAFPLSTMLAVRRLRAEQAQVDGAAELVQLRCWSQAALVIEQFLSRPSRSPQMRAQALIYLASVLARYHRFDDAIAVQNFLIEHDLIDPGTAYGLRIGRVMAMLREDHLFDADRAIGELRRLGGSDSPGLALVEIYRDVKTGHPAEAVEIFEKKLPILRDHLGVRIADVYALVARALDLLDRETDAQAAWRKATLLSPVAELLRRYPELEKMAARLEPAPAPPEAM